MSRKPLIAGNWKMNCNHFEAIALVQKIAFSLPDKYFDKVDVAVIPPFMTFRPEAGTGNAPNRHGNDRRKYEAFILAVLIKPPGHANHRWLSDVGLAFPAFWQQAIDRIALLAAIFAHTSIPLETEDHMNAIQPGPNPARAEPQRQGYAPSACWHAGYQPPRTQRPIPLASR